MIERVVIFSALGMGVLFLLLVLVNLLCESIQSDDRIKRIALARLTVSRRWMRGSAGSGSRGRPGMSAFVEMNRRGEAGSVTARTPRIKRYPPGTGVPRLDEGPSLAGWAVYIASAVAFVMLCAVAAFK